jgi:hypothetical protein
MTLDAWVDQLGQELRTARPHRRVRATAVLLAVILSALVGGGVALIASTLNTQDRETPATPSYAVPTRVPPDTVLRRTYMGVACPVPNDLSCDRVGLYVELRYPARAVEADIAGRRIRLDDPHWSGPARRGIRNAFAGFLRPAGLTRPGPLEVRPDRATSARVRLIITRGDGTQVQTTQTIGLAPGWG